MGGGSKHLEPPPSLIAKWYRIVHWRVYRLVPRDYDNIHDDVVQDVIIELAKRYDGKPHHKGFIEKVIKGKLIDNLRRYGKHTRGGHLHPTFVNLIELHRPPSYEFQYTDKFILDSQLSEGQKKVAVLLAMGYKPGEVAEILDISTNRVTNVQWRLRHYLREKEKSSD